MVPLITKCLSSMRALACTPSPLLGGGAGPWLAAGAEHLPPHPLPPLLRLHWLAAGCCISIASASCSMRRTRGISRQSAVFETGLSRGTGGSRQRRQWRSSPPAPSSASTSRLVPDGYPSDRGPRCIRSASPSAEFLGDSVIHSEQAPRHIRATRHCREHRPAASELRCAAPPLPLRTRTPPGTLRPRAAVLCSRQEWQLLAAHPPALLIS